MARGFRFTLPCLALAFAAAGTGPGLAMSEGIAASKSAVARRHVERVYQPLDGRATRIALNLPRAFPDVTPSSFLILGVGF